MDNIKDVLSELLETYTRSKFEIESILRIYEDRIKHEMGLIDIQNREESPCVRIVVTPNNQVKGGNKEQRCPDTVKRENKLY